LYDERENNREVLRFFLEDMRHRWEDNIKVDLKEIGCEGVT
jgi:hypothetical protein